MSASETLTTSGEWNPNFVTVSRNVLTSTGLVKLISTSVPPSKSVPHLGPMVRKAMTVPTMSNKLKPRK